MIFQSYFTIPFFVILFSIAVFPLIVPKFWHQHYGKFILFMTSIFILLLINQLKVLEIIDMLSHIILVEYIPFILLLSALYVVASGIVIKGNWKATPFNNSLLLFCGAILASVIGTTGASILMIKPVIRANLKRDYKTHVLIFFIFLVANIGGGLTPLGDPPLFIGYLKGITFSWNIRYMFIPVFLNLLVLLTIFYFIDSMLMKKEINQIKHTNYKFKVYGKRNIVLLLIIIGILLVTSLFSSNNNNIIIFNTNIHLNNVIRDISLVIVIILSICITPQQIKISNQFSWEPIKEITKLFLGIFITIIPVIEILKLGNSGSFASIFNLVNANGTPVPYMYFFISGILSGFLDNAPTYLIFFNMASGNPDILMYEIPKVLLAISSGTVFMGALTYIGNAPNLLIKNIAYQYEIKMPSFFSYMKWSCCILLPSLLITMFFVINFI